MKQRIYIFFALLFFSVSTLFSQESSAEFSIRFRINSDIIDTDFNGNALTINDIQTFFEYVAQDTNIVITSIVLQGSSSPEGNYEFNNKVAAGRLSAVKKLIDRYISLPDSIITCLPGYIQWDSLKAFVIESDIPGKERIASIIDEEESLVELYEERRIDSRVLKLKRFDKGKAWRYMYRNYFGKMRNSCVAAITFKRDLPPLVTETVAFDKPMPAVDKDIPGSYVPMPVASPSLNSPEWTPRLHIKTNALYYAVLLSNIEVEADFAKHWSFSLPVYYSALNYFVSTIKFRTIALQPELRYWFDKNNSKWFVGAHFSYAQFNVAANGKYRYQDHGGKSPALGGGLSFGYRMPLSKNKRWNVEFSAGAGVYPIHYDKFLNTPDVKDGLYVNSGKFLYWGLDKLSVSFSYSFDLKKAKGGRK